VKKPFGYITSPQLWFYGRECLPYVFLLYLRTLVYMCMSHREFIIVKDEFIFFFPKIFKGVFSCYDYIFPDDLS
jgi:hypothetical protein